MDLPDFKTSLGRDVPPSGLNVALRALWHQGKGDWDQAHRLAQSATGSEGDWVHAHLHRVEGDAANAGYWYRRAGKTVPSNSLDSEWEDIVSALLRTRD